MRRTSVITYTRVSTKAQGAKVVSLEDQQVEIDEFLDLNNMQSFGIFSDVGSGFNEEEGSKRENYVKLCRIALKNDWDVVTTVPSRFTRTPEELDRYFAKGGRLICVELGIDATNEEIRAYLLAEIVQHEQRQRMAAAGQERARAKGRVPGNPDLAPARQKSLQVRQEKALLGYAEFERQLDTAREEGASTPKEIATAFNRAAFKTSQNVRWKEGNVRRVLQTIADLKAARDVASAVDPISAGNDNEEQPTLFSAASAIGLEDAAQPASAVTQASYALSADELAEFCERLEQSLAPPEQIEGLIRTAADPALTRERRASIMNWIAKKRAA